MGKKIRKWVCVLLAVTLLATSLPLIAGAVAPSGESASSSGQAPLKVEIKSNKEKYTLLGKMEFTATITNTSSSTVENICAVALFGASLRPLKGSTLTTSKASLAPNESFSFTYYADLNGLKSLDNLLLPFFWISSLLHGGKADTGTGNGSDYIEASKTVGLISLFSGQYDASTKVRVWYGEGPSDDDGFGPDEIYEYTDDDISYDEAEEEYYINNVVIISFDWDTTDQRKRDIVKSINGEVVGQISGLNQLHIKVPKKTYIELVALCEKLMNNNEDVGVFARFDTLFELDNDERRITNMADFYDPYIFDGNSSYVMNWDENNPVSFNWHLLAIQAPSAWQYDYYFRKIEIGVYDGGFDTEHEDLDIWFWDESNRKQNASKEQEHGTHVAGIIGANFNKIGVNGIVRQADLNCYVVTKTEANKSTYTAFSKGLESLVKSGCKVINVSQGFCEKLLDNSNSDIPDKKVKESATIISEAMARLLENKKEKYDFVVVQSAGNGANDPSDTNPIEEDRLHLGVDAMANGLFASVTSDNCYSKSKTVSKQDIMDRIIIVTSADKKYDSINRSWSYIMAESANGGKQVDIAAPGVNVYSTVPKGTKDSLGNGYKALSGTSMAAPMVASVVALVWSVLPPLFNGAQVKNIVCKSTNTWVADNEASPKAVPPNSNGYRMVNAKLAVEEAIKLTYSAGTFSGLVKDVDTDEPLGDAIVIVKSADKSKVIPVKTGPDGTFDLVLPVGNYKVDVSLATNEVYYEPQTFNITISANSTIEVSILLQKVNSSVTVSPMLAVGGHALALKSDGTIWAWGDNSEGQLGLDNTIVFRGTPTRVQHHLSNVIALDAGSLHSLALKSDGTVWAWGWNGEGQLGNDTVPRAESSSNALQVQNLNDITAISTRGLHSLALKSDGTVWAWGYNNRGQIGDNTTTNCYVPIQVPNLSNVVAISAGDGFSIVLKGDGTVWAWGNNTSGELGDNTTTSMRGTPVQTQNLSDVMAVSTGSNFSIALKSNGTVWAWGGNSSGQLGDNTSTSRRIPVQVQNLSNVRSISAGSSYALALKNDSTIWAWGDNWYGQLGYGATPYFSPIPVLVQNLSDVSAISAGGNCSYALKNNGEVWAWGNNSGGWLLGDGTTTTSYTPRQVKGPDGVEWLNLLQP